ncbi:MAG TPA: cobalamin-dependent protein, partial [Acidimicrobiales bacterium]
MAETDMTLQEAADALGVHYMTAYRYVRLGLLPAHKGGSTWRVDPTDVEAFKLTSASDAASAPGRRRKAPWAERLEARLLAGDLRGAWGVVEAAMAAGATIDVIYLDVIAPAMASIGEGWEAGKVDIAAEHRASGIALRLVSRLGPRFARRGRTRGTVVLGTPAGERHSLPVAMLADLVRAAGFEVSDLGADLPPDSFATLAGAVSNLVAVGVSCTSDEAVKAVAATITSLRSTIGAVPVVLGGRALRDAAHARSLGADAYAADGRAFVELL